MTRAVTKHRKSLEMQTYLFEIGEWEPLCSLSVNFDRGEDGPYNEYVGIKFAAPCIFPERLAGRIVEFHFMGRRDHIQPAIIKRGSGWRPSCIGALQMPPRGGHFYA